MIKYDNGKIQRMTLDIEPDQTAPNPEFHQKLLAEFASMSTTDRAIIIEFGMEMRARKWQESADAITGYYNGRD